MEKNHSPSSSHRILNQRIKPRIRYNRETDEIEIEVIYDEDIVVEANANYMVTFTQHLGLMQHNDWMTFETTHDACNKATELKENDNITNIVISKITPMPYKRPPTGEINGS